MIGVHTGGMPDLPATGRPYRIVGAGVGRIRDGQTVELTEYWTSPGSWDRWALFRGPRAESPLRANTDPAGSH